MTVRQVMGYSIAAAIFWYVPASVVLVDFYGRVHRPPTMWESIGILGYMLVGLIAAWGWRGGNGR